MWTVNDLLGQIVILWIIIDGSHCIQYVFNMYVQLTVVLYMSFDRFLFTVESHDLSQADKIISLLFQLALGKIDVLVNFIIRKFATFKSLQFSQLFR